MLTDMQAWKTSLLARVDAEAPGWADAAARAIVEAEPASRHGVWDRVSVWTYERTNDPWRAMDYQSWGALGQDVRRRALELSPDAMVEIDAEAAHRAYCRERSDG